MEMEVFIRVLVYSVVSGALLIWGWRILNWVWLKPKKMEKWLRQQGLPGNSYRFLSGDIEETFSMIKQARSKPMPLSDDNIVPYVSPFLHQTVNKYYGKNSFMWIGPRPSVIVTEPEEIKENMLSAFYQSCIEVIISDWEKKVSTEGSSEVDVWPYIVNLTGDAISRAAFGSSYKEGTRIFQLLEEQVDLTMGMAQSGHIIPGWR
ncbi:Cytochrome P450 [Corchorus capsularis]|uniref:Cytochrome P450 n=1 Tax=Corchorus capsularis TaxID=210143 RepID=A0A1R3HWB6_COCAP|nr:Cytochrome P450 [Corchorus capsularis]